MTTVVAGLSLSPVRLVVTVSVTMKQLVARATAVSRRLERALLGEFRVPGTCLRRPLLQLELATKPLAIRQR